MDWIDKNKENSDINVLDSKIKEIEAEIKPILAKIQEEATNIPPPSGKEARATLK